MINLTFKIPNLSAHAKLNLKKNISNAEVSTEVLASPRLRVLIPPVANAIKLSQACIYRSVNTGLF